MPLVHPSVRGIHRAWWVALVTFLVLLASAAFRSSFGVLLVPIESDLGWARADTSLAVSVNLVVYGLTAPFAAAVMERFGVRQVIVPALLLVAAGCGLTTLMSQPWHLTLLWGVLVGLGTGASALVFGAIVANRWFARRRGLVVGALGTAWATGQLVFLPLLARLTEHLGWRAASFAVAVFALALVPLVSLLLADRPADVGLLPFGATPAAGSPAGDGGDASGAKPAGAADAGPAAAQEDRVGAVAALRLAARTRAFWLLAGTFLVCGWTTNGIVSTHFVPAAHDHGMAATTAAGVLAVVGLFDIIGTLGSGWLTDRFDPRLLLAVYYALRGSALLAVPAILGPDVAPPLLLVAVLFGLDWVATVPPTVALCREAFGAELGGIVFGWVFAAHMVGAAAAAAASGLLRTASGSYTSAWLLAGALALAAAAAALAIPRPPALVATAPGPVAGPRR